MHFIRFIACFLVVVLSTATRALPLLAMESDVSNGGRQTIFETSEWVRAALWLTRTPTVRIVFYIFNASANNDMGPSIERCCQ